jgi:murein hydrolase activator
MPICFMCTKSAIRGVRHVNRRAIALLFLCGAVLSAGQEQDKLAKVQKRIDEINTRLESIKNEKSGILNDIYKIELEQEMVGVELIRVNVHLREAKQKVRVKKAQEDKLQADVSASRDKLGRVVRVLYKMGSWGYVKFFFNSGSFDQLFRNYRMMTGLVDYKMHEMEKLKSDLAALEKVRSELEQERNRWGGLQAEKASKNAQLNAKKQEKIEYIRHINQEREAHQRLLDELQQEEAALNGIIEQHSTELPLPAINFHSLRGKMPWPVKGRVVSNYGRVKSSRFATYTFNNGIEISPSGSDDIRVVAVGRIQWVDYLIGYGKLIIIQHDRNFHTLYGHCEEFLKKEGDFVEAGDLIARVGSSGSLQGKCLYFEVRENLKAEEPLKWLGKR